MHHLPNRNNSELYWTFNDKRIHPSVIIDNYSFVNKNFHAKQQKQNRFFKLSAQRHHNYYMKHEKNVLTNNLTAELHQVESHAIKKRNNFHPVASSFTLFNNKYKNVTRLQIRGLDVTHKGVYKCKYNENIGSEFNLDFQIPGNML